MSYISYLPSSINRAQKQIIFGIPPFSSKLLFVSSPSNIHFAEADLKTPYLSLFLYH